uniref:Calcium binding and coiled-coil domain 1a n=1 Tax=Lates calcarifer TaxID=8187 RepID=A0A4W6FLJ6_LATCA
MDKAWRVEFRNVGCSYFPQSRVDCHYTLSSEHNWASNDWIGLFKVGWSSVKEYHTFVWASAPADYQEGTDVNCCVHFQASYLPKPSSQEYEFVYVDAKGEVCSRSSKFTFCAPKPLEDLVTLEEEPHGEEVGTGMLLVVPRAELLQVSITNEEQALGESLAQEKSALLDAREASEVRIQELEEDIKTLTERTVERETELERSDIFFFSLSLFPFLLLLVYFQNWHHVADPIYSTKHAFLFLYHQTESEAALKEMRSLRERLNTSERAAEGLKSDLSAMVAQRDHGQAELHQARLQAAQLTLQLADSSLALREGRAHWAQERQSLQRTAEKDHEHLEKLNAEMQRMEERLQEERMERVKLEVELGREKDCNRVQLSETRRELQELKASLRVAQKEKEQLLAEKQELMEYICQLEQKMGTAASAKWSTALTASTGRPDSALSDSEDENPEALQPLRPPRPLGHYSLCEQGQPDSLLLTTPPPSPREMERSAVVINQPAPLSSPHQAGADTLAHSSDSVRRAI